MHPSLCSLIFTLVLHATLRSTMAITGCTVTLMNSNSTRRKVLCADPKTLIVTIPENLPRSTDKLIISYQNITAVQENDFSAISDMKTLLLTFSNLRMIHRNSFKTLRNLIYLDLSGNNLTISSESLPMEIFSILASLEVLKLSSNPLGFIPDLLFRAMSTSLRILHLNKCNVPPLKISPRAFKGILNLKELDLRESSIVSLLPPMEDDFREMKSLKGLFVSGNNFFCDCQFRWFYFFLTDIQETVTISEDGDKEIRCAGPEKVSDREIPVKDDRHQMRSSDFVCAPKCSLASARELLADAGSSINLTCNCFTDPIQRVTWTKNGHTVEETNNKYRLYHTGKETFQTTLNIVSLQPLDSGNWSCQIGSETFQNVSLKVKSMVVIFSIASINVYILVALGSSLFLICLVVIIAVMFCRRESICSLRNQHPMVICGYETNTRKPSMIDGDLQYRYNHQDGRFNTSFYENTIPFDLNLSLYQRSNHLYPDDLLSEKNIELKSSEKLLNNMYCGCNSHSDDDHDQDLIRSSFTRRSSRHSHKKEERSRDIETLLPAMSQCPFHGSSGTLTRVPGHKPCPVHGSTATLPSRLSSKNVEHRFGCPKHSKDNISVKSLKLDEPQRPHRSKSVGKMSATPTSYKPCPLHGDLLTAINENLLESISNQNGANQLATIKKSHSKAQQVKSLKIPVLGCDSSVVRQSSDTMATRRDLFQLSSISISQTLTSPVQSSLSSSPLLTSDVHGTLV